ncbi:hypothetical protein KP509_30G042200 [Ceratopteris richardii]|uniref:RRM domain-containing protein n=1 Tax=Ceratopteris richardii TaxID=49495 RepID=A0A8T2R469_CERRI|nr:hypothetical protein KP509_30G042200 [Ceratopteris richardii]
MTQRPSSGSSSSSSVTDTSLTKIFVGGLAWETQCESMRRYFEQFGEIVEAVVIIDRQTGRSKGYGFVTFRDPDAARRACENPAPFIDGRRTNCNLAVLGVQRPRGRTPLFQGPRFFPVNNDFNARGLGGAPQFGHPLPVVYNQQGYPYPYSIGYPTYLPDCYAPPSIYNPYAGHPQQMITVRQPNVPAPSFQHLQSANMQPTGQHEPQVHGGLPIAMPPSPLNFPSYFVASPAFMQSSGHLPPGIQLPSSSQIAFQALPSTPGASGQQSST